MSMHIKHENDTRAARACVRNLADYPGGVTLDTSGLDDGDTVKEGTPIQFDAGGTASVIASDAAASALTKANYALLGDSYKVESGKDIEAVAVLIGTFRKSLCPTISSATAAKLTGIVFI